MMRNNVVKPAIYLYAIALIMGTLLATKGYAVRVGFAFDGYVDPSNDSSKTLFKTIIPNNSRVTGTFSYDTSTIGIVSPEGTKAFHQSIDGGYKIDFEGGPLLIAASDYIINVGNDYQPSN